MKNTIFLSILGLTLFVSCTETVENDVVPVETSENVVAESKKDPIVNRWVLKSRNSEDNKDSVNYDNEYSDMVLSLAGNGYFTIYDSIKNVENLDPNLRLQVRSKGQWMYNNNVLVLKHIIDNIDSVRVEKLNVEQLDDSSLITITTDKEVNSYTNYSK